jgi:hypothetical protein
MRYFYAFVGLLVAATFVTFLRYVALWSVLTVSLVFLGMVLTFLLGVLAGSGHALPWRQEQLSDGPLEADSALTTRLAGSAGTRRPQRHQKFRSLADRRDTSWLARTYFHG